MFIYVFAPPVHPVITSRRFPEDSVELVVGSGPAGLGSDPVLTTCSPSMPRTSTCKVGKHNPGCEDGASVRSAAGKHSACPRSECVGGSADGLGGDQQRC